jgi:hypothetical protein
LTDALFDGEYNETKEIHLFINFYNVFCFCN